MDRKIDQNHWVLVGITIPDPGIPDIPKFGIIKQSNNFPVKLNLALQLHTMPLQDFLTGSFRL